MDLSLLLPDHIFQICISDENDKQQHYVYSNKLLKAGLLIQYAIASSEDLEWKESSFISVLTYNEKESNRFFALLAKNEIPPIVFARIIIDLVAFIEKLLYSSSPLNGELARISVGIYSSKDEKTRRKKKERYELDKNTMLRVMYEIKIKDALIS
jgi:hypothetical protein